jgi:hypothetical protein
VLPPIRVGVGSPLPSGEAADKLIAGAPGGLTEVVATTAARAALVGTGLFFAGFRGKDLAKGTIAATATIEVFVLGWAFATRF